ncbi:MAG TPA: ABC transporter permease, partial [Chloroflexi bacterium]|nr:ABC transporter permease [Chloroflexota bacterium]
MGTITSFLTRTRGRGRLHFTDIITYLYLILGTFLMFGPVVWLIFSSFKTQAEIVKFPPRLLPYRQETVVVEGYDEPLPLYLVTLENGSTAELAQVRRIGLESQLVDPANPDEIIKIPIDQREPIEKVVFSFDNYIEGVESFNFARYLRNSLIVTIFATLLTLLINSMAAFALAKYHFRGREAIFFIMLSTLMVPLSVILVPVFLVITTIDWNNNLLGVIVPAAATPTGLFLLRQYMLTIPDELLDAARIDGASEWRIYAQVILPLAKPALAVLTIFSVMWRWNDFLWPLIVLTRSEFFTLQVGLNSFQGELNVQWHLILAMTVLTLLP